MTTYLGSVSGRYGAVGTDAERLAETLRADQAGFEFIVNPGGATWMWTGDEWVQTGIGGVQSAAISNGLATKTRVLAATVADAGPDILGFLVTASGSASWTLTFKNDGVARTVPQTALLVGQVYPFELSAITSGTGGTALLFLPT